jgi:predicted PurR-regulated permease PerM
MIYFLVFIVFIIFIKYVIDTRSTIKELRLERNRYRTIVWKNNTNKDSGQKLNWLYKNIKSQILELINDIKDTDFNDYQGDIKKNILSALENIDSYSTNIENEDMDTLTRYKEDHGKTK